VNALQMASAVLGGLPLVFVFLLAQRQIVEGVAGTGLK
jgi:multiple sugar transport system permease protein